MRLNSTYLRQKLASVACFTAPADSTALCFGKNILFHVVSYLKRRLNHKSKRWQCAIYERSGWLEFHVVSKVSLSATRVLFRLIHSPFQNGVLALIALAHAPTSRWHISRLIKTHRPHSTRHIPPPPEKIKEKKRSSVTPYITHHTFFLFFLPFFSS